MTARTKMLVAAGFALLLGICFLSSRLPVDAAGGSATPPPTPLAPMPSTVSFSSATYSVGEADGNTSFTLIKGSGTDVTIL